METQIDKTDDQEAENPDHETGTKVEERLLIHILLVANGIHIEVTIGPGPH